MKHISRIDHRLEYFEDCNFALWELLVCVCCAGSAQGGEGWQEEGEVYGLPVQSTKLARLQTILTSTCSAG